MEKKLIDNISNEPTNSEMEKFDSMVKDFMIKEPSVSFTQNVMAKIQPSSQKADKQLWWILLGTVMTACIWLVGGFGNAAPIAITLPQVALPSVEMGPLVKGFGFINLMLILLLLDRYFQKRKRVV